MKVLVLGITGMLGSAVFREFLNSENISVFGTARSSSARLNHPNARDDQILAGIDLLNQDSLLKAFNQVNPDVVINCAGLIKQLDDAGDPLVALPINSMLPHRLAHLCEICGSRLILISTDCVFSGKTGNYSESAVSDVSDLYGMSKYIGEIGNASHVVTLRTSIIGHELNSKNALIEWFLSQEGEVKGYTEAIFSGLPTVELARVIRDYVVPNSGLSGLYHVSAKPISKFDLLRMVSERYKKSITIKPDDKLKIDRSLNSERFAKATGYTAPEWEALVDTMYRNRNTGQ